MGYNKKIDNGVQHEYVLPDGRVKDNMKEVCDFMKLSSTSVKNLIRKGIVIKKIKDIQSGVPNGESGNQ